MECLTICKALWLHKVQERITKDATASSHSITSLYFKADLRKVSSLGLTEPTQSDFFRRSAVLLNLHWSGSLPSPFLFNTKSATDLQAQSNVGLSMSRSVPIWMWQTGRRLFLLSLTLLYPEFWSNCLFEESCLTEGTQLGWGTWLVFPRQGKTSGATGVAQCMADSTGVAEVGE
jgi:hypothetical protein